MEKFLFSIKEVWIPSLFFGVVFLYVAIFAGGYGFGLIELSPKQFYYRQFALIIFVLAAIIAVVLLINAFEPVLVKWRSMSREVTVLFKCAECGHEAIDTVRAQFDLTEYGEWSEAFYCTNCKLQHYLKFYVDKRR